MQPHMSIFQMFQHRGVERGFFLILKKNKKKERKNNNTKHEVLAAMLGDFKYGDMGLQTFCKQQTDKQYDSGGSGGT